MKNLVCEDWSLLDLRYEGEIHTDPYTSEKYADIKPINKSIRVFGTYKQLRKLSDKYNIDEVYKYEKIEKGSWWDGIVCGDRPDRLSREEYNKKVVKKYSEYKLLYELNNNEPLILNTL
jgi:hypothetical protein